MLRGEEEKERKKRGEEEKEEGGLRETAVQGPEIKHSHNEVTICCVRQ